MPNRPQVHRRPAWRILVVLVPALLVGLWWRARPDFQGNRSGVGLGVAQDLNSPRADEPVAVAPGAAPGYRPKVLALFAYAQPPNAAELDAALPAPTRKIHYVRATSALAVGKQSPFWQPRGVGRVEIPLPEGEALTVVIDSSEMLGADRFTSEGRLEGRPGSTVVLAYNQGFLHGTFSDPGLGGFALRVADGEYSQFYQIDPGQVGPCGGAWLPGPAGPAQAGPPRERSGQAEAALEFAVPLTAAAGNAQRADVHVMMVYTQAALPTLAGAARVAALQSAFDAAIARVNSAFAASAITARVRLVRIFETQYAADGPAGGFFLNLQNEALTALYRTDDRVMDEIHAARDQAGADIVCLALNRTDAQSSGLSFLLGEPGQLRSPQFSFSVVQYSGLSGTNVVPHEFGHLFGCAHDRAYAQNGPGSYSYSYGYTFTASDNRRYHDIMAYPPGVELNYYSNPRIFAPAPAPGNTPGGIAAGQPGESDAALTIEQNAFEVSTFRLQTQASPFSGTLINVSTLAYTGPGDQVLIGGFVVVGSRPKKLLVRAAGPALRPFGVANALADPFLRVFSGSEQMAVNDNWWQQGQPGSAAEVAAEALAVGAFPFAPSSTDAALLVTLPPGPYTAWVEGANGTTGRGLVEVYDIDRGGHRVINVSSRGYADHRGQEMIGGFVVEGVAGSTKRILIRVLGPTLDRSFGLGGAMSDPHLELRNAAGELLVQNDDWSTGSRLVGAQRDDFQPYVQTYGELQIAATGFAPTNRREPCVLVDLPPGSYTAIVRPFEFRSPDADLDQPAQPGLALVEVYEIAR